MKAKVTLVEKHRMGGDCLNTGCVPSKALIRSAKFLSHIKRAQRVRHRVGVGRVRLRRRDGARAARDPGPSSRTTRSSATPASASSAWQGEAKITSPWTVEVQLPDGATRTLTTRSIVIAAGARPFVPPIPGIEEVGYLTSDTVWDLRELPRRLVVLGGGPIGCELAQCFARLGSKVTQVEMLPRIMIREDPEISEMVDAALPRGRHRRAASTTRRRRS